MASKNPCARTVKPEQAYEVWQTENHPAYGGTWTWYILKKYQSPEKETQNPHARWLCMVTSPYTSARGDWGDVYVRDILATGAQRIANPLTCTHDKTTGKE